jgi:type VI secretion system secreted protein VgrG
MARAIKLTIDTPVPAVLEPAAAITRDGRPPPVAYPRPADPAAPSPRATQRPLDENALLFHAMSGREELARLFEYDVSALSTRGDILPADLLGKSVTVKVELQAGGYRYFNGYVVRFAQGTELVGRRHEYRMTLRPWLWFLTRTTDCRIFQDQTVPDIVKKVFADHAAVAVFEKPPLLSTYSKREYCVQYRETDFDFVSRLLEEEGIYYYFDHEDGRHTLRLVDSPSGHEPLANRATIRYYPLGRELYADEEYIHSWSCVQEIQSGTVALRDYDFTKPKADLAVMASTRQRPKPADYEWFDYPGEYRETGDGEHYARTRIDELHTQFERAEAACNVREIAVGRLFTLTNAPRPDYEREYLIVGAHYDLQSNAYETVPTTEGADYRCTFVALQSRQQFRPARLTPRPTVKGTQTALVVGPAGDEIYCDPYGRVKVQFHWDRYGESDANSSCWIRVAQNLAGKRWGMVFIPRIGQEVIVDFLEGDPDQPIIVGALYNDMAMPPYPLAEHKTKTVLFKSNSTLGGNGFNEIRIEDKKGEEQVFIHGEKDLDVRIKNDRREWVGRDRHLIVKRDKVEEVDRDEHIIVQRDLVEEIRRDRHLTVSGKQAISVTGSHSLHVTGDVAEQFKMSHSEQVAMNYSLKGMQVVLEGLTGLTIKVGPSFITLSPAGVQIVGPMVLINSGGAPQAVPTIPAVAPISPAVAEVADNANPGSTDETYRKQRAALSPEDLVAKDAPWHNPASEETRRKRHWIEIELVDEDGQPVPGERYRITLPDGTTLAEGTLDGKGFARVHGIDPGTCKVTFPNLDGAAWRPA